jgi:hypothetical protein
MTADSDASLYFTADLRSSAFPFAGPPVIWLQFAGEAGPVPAWRLTPDTWARVWWQLSRLEDRWARGEYDLDKMEAAWDRWRALHAFAVTHYGLPALDAARAKMEALGGPVGKLPPPPENPPDVWGDGWTFDGTKNKWVPADLATAKESPTDGR